MFYRNDPKFSDRQIWANSVDQGAVWSGSTLFAILPALFGHITPWYIHIVQFLGCLQQYFQVSVFLGILRYFNTCLK